MKELEFLQSLLPAEDQGQVALKKSIEHWARFVLNKSASNEDIGEQDCALCHEFHSHYTGNTSCAGCPIEKATGQDYCEGTPFPDCCRVTEGFHSPEFRAEALKMLMFLEGLVK
jgi:hypothetical protein